MTSLGQKLVIALDVFVKHERGVSFASLAHDRARKEIRKSDAALVRKLKSRFGPGHLPTSKDIWGNDIFSEALNR